MFLELWCDSHHGIEIKMGLSHSLGSTMKLNPQRGSDIEKNELCGLTHRVDFNLM